MGCDIHLMLEYRVKPECIPNDINDFKYDNLKDAINKFDRGEITEEDLNEAKKKWSNYSIMSWRKEWCNSYMWRSDTWPGERTYGMFAKLANVRNYWNNIEPFEVKGFPMDASEDVFSKYAYSIIEDEDWRDYHEDGYYIKRSEVEENIKRYDEKIIKYKDREFLTCCDHHSASWISTLEMEEAINFIFKDKTDLASSYVCWAALLGAMKGIESNGIYECRAVFWFDN
jgi:hypothetical protein